MTDIYIIEDDVYATAECPPELEHGQKAKIELSWNNVDIHRIYYCCMNKTSDEDDWQFLWSGYLRPDSFIDAGYIFELKGHEFVIS